MTRTRALAAAFALAATTIVAAPGVGRAAPVEECTTVMNPAQGHGCTLDLAPGDHRIRVDMLARTGSYDIVLRDSAGVLVYQASCTIEPTRGYCSGSSGFSREARVNGGGGGLRSVVVVTHSYEHVSATLSNGGTASLEVGPGTGAVTLDAS